MSGVSHQPVGGEEAAFDHSPPIPLPLIPLPLIDCLFQKLKQLPPNPLSASFRHEAIFVP